MLPLTVCPDKVVSSRDLAPRPKAATKLQILLEISRTHVRVVSSYRLVGVIDASVNHCHGRALASDSSLVQLIHSSPVVSRGVWMFHITGQLSPLRQRSHWDRSQGPDVDDSLN